MQVTQAWDITRGSNDIIVAVVDTGVDMDHPELKDYLIEGYDFINEDSDPDDDNGHGTHVAGIIGASINNSLGIAGVASGVKIMPVKVLKANSGGNSHNIARGIVWAVNHGARVINLSLGTASSNNELNMAITYALGKNVVVTAANTNDGENKPKYPAAYSGMGVIAVGATNIKNKLADFSNWGKWTSVVAPGVNILSTYPQGKGPSELETILGTRDYNILSGTSQATPYISGIAALLLSYKPELTNYQVKYILENTAQKLNSKSFDDHFGNGLVNAYKALKMVEKGSIDKVSSIRIDSIRTSPFYMKPGDSVTLTVNVHNPENKKLGYGWAVSKGKIEGQGQTVTWLAPDKPGKYQVVAGVNDGEKKVYATVNAVIYYKEENNE